MFVLFSGSRNPSTNMSWCPDCVHAEPIISQALAGLGQPYVLLSCDVDREPYRKPDYPYRVDPAIALR